MDDPKLLSERKEGEMIYSESGERMMLLPAGFYKAMYEALRDVMGSAARTMVYYIGVKAGRLMAKDAARMREGSGNLADVKAVAEVLQEMGIGKVEKVEQSDSKIILVLGETISDFVKLPEQDRCHLERGLVAGVLEALTGKKPMVKQLKNGGHCTFEIEFR